MPIFNKTNQSLHILDLGTGMGSLPIMIRKLSDNYQITACDIKFQSNVKEVLVNERINTVEGVVFKPDGSLPFENNTYDVVLFTDVLEHIIDDPEHVIAEIHRVLRAGGSLILTTPNFAHVFSRIKVLFGKQTQDFLSSDRHFRIYTMDELLNMLQKGYIVKYAEFISTVESWRFTGLSKIGYYLYRVTQIKPSFRATIIISAEKIG
jgi:SAM-dependent methyltransferase